MLVHCLSLAKLWISSGSSSSSAHRGLYFSIRLSSCRAYGEIEPHVAFDHDVDVVAHRFARAANHLDVLLQSGQPFGHRIAAPHFHAAEAGVLAGDGFGLQPIEVARVKPAVVGGDGRLGPAAEQHEHRLIADVTLDVPQSDVDGADRGQHGALATEGDRRSVHLLEQVLRVERILADKTGASLPSTSALQMSGHSPALPRPTSPSSVSISTTSQLKKRNGACASFWNGSALSGVAKTVSSIFTGPLQR